MGTKATQLTVPPIVEILAPSGTYEKRRIELRKEYSPVLAASKKITVIETPEQAEAATQYGRTLQNGLKEMETFFKGIKSQIDEIKKPVLQAEKDDSGPLTQEKSRLGTLLTSYQALERRKREEEERQAREEAQRQAEAEALERAMALAASGEEEAAEAVLEEPVVAAPVVIPASAPKPTGSVARKNYSIRVTDLKALVQAVAKGEVLIAAVQPDLAWLGAKARNEKELFHVPGVELVVTESTSFRA